MKKLKLRNYQMLLFFFSYIAILLMLIIDYVTYLKNNDLEISIAIALIVLIMLIIIVCINIYFIKTGWGKADGKIYYSELSMREQFFILFADKKCPNCFDKLMKKKTYSFVEKGIRRVGNSTIGGDIFQEKIIYVCESCKKEYTVLQLIKSSAKQ